MKRLHDSVEMDLAYAERVSDEIYRHQPFILSLLLGYKDDMTQAELDELVVIFFLIWEQFKDKRNIKSVKLTQKNI